MKIYIRLCIAIIALTSCNGNTQRNKVEKEQQDSISKIDSLSANDIGFGLLNAERSACLILDSENSNNSFIAYVATSRQEIPITFETIQTPVDSSHANQTSSNFANNSGKLYRLKNQAKSEIDYILAYSENLRKQYQFLSVNAVFEDMKNLSFLEEIEKTFKSKSKISKLIATTIEKDSVFMIQLHPIQDSVNVLLICKPQNSPNYFIQEHKALWNATSTWRVDDGGEFPIQSFKILNIFKKDGKTDLVTYFPGAEGANLSYLTADDNFRYFPLKENYAH